MTKAYVKNIIEDHQSFYIKNILNPWWQIFI